MMRFALLVAISMVTTSVWAAPQTAPTATSTAVDPVAAPLPHEDPEVSAAEAKFQAKVKVAEEKEARKAAKREAKFDKMAKEKGVFYTNGRMDFVKLDDMKESLVKHRSPQHPIQIPLDKMKVYLSSITYSEHNLLKKGPEIDRVFNDRAVDFLAPIIVKAFAQATPNEAVTVSWLTKDPMFIVRNDRIVIGSMWVQNGQLYVQFNKLLAKLVGDTDKQDTFNFVISNAKSLRIKLVSAGSVVVTNKRRNEIAINMAGDFSNVTAPDATTAKGAAAKSSVNQRLQDLEQLRRDKMVTEAEYLAKRKQILENL